MTNIPVFWIEPTDRTEQFLRRYVSSEARVCPAKGQPFGYCEAMVQIEDGQIIHLPDNCYRNALESVSHADPRWPRCCEACGYAFQEDDNWQVFASRIYMRPDTWDEMTLRTVPVGAIWRADWHEPHTAGPDGMCIMCQTPAGEWLIDSVATNCDRPQDKEHRCWVRHGDPRDPQGVKTGQPLHVDKNGNTCNAGAGSIWIGPYHGFLHNGHLTNC